MNAKMNADLDNDGVITTEELAAVDQHHKVETQTRIALFIAFAGIIGAFFGMTGWMSKK